jgi:RNA polymerase sigma-70 factor (ECF subfamily)
MAHEADRALARALIAGNEREFDRFFTEYFERLFRFAITRLDADEQAAQDIVQTTLINAMRGIAGYRGEASMFTWLCQICRNEINAHFRKLARSVPVVAEDDDNIRPILEALESEPGNDPDKQYQGLQLSRLIQEVLDHLPANYGNALEWKYIEGFSVTEIAERLEVTELAAQSTLARARNAFREALVKITPQLAGQ